MVREEWRLVKVQGGSRMVVARGSEEYVRGSLPEWAAHTPTEAWWERTGKPPVDWEVHRVEVTEQLLDQFIMTASELAEARQQWIDEHPAPEQFSRQAQQRIEREEDVYAAGRYRHVAQSVKAGGDVHLAGGNMIINRD